MKKRKVLLGGLILVITSLLLQSVQLKDHSLYLGYDWLFHYNRFYDAAQQIKDGNFQYFISMYGFSQSGRIINALYGPVFAYLNGLLLLLCQSWFRFQLVSNFLLTLLAAISMFTLLYKNKIRLSISLILAVLYSCLYVVQSWTFNQAFGSWGAFILPLVVLSGTQFLKEDYSRRQAAFLIFAMTVAIQVHVLTTLFSVLILAIFFVAGFVRSSHKGQLFIKVVIAAIATVLMTANVWYPLFEVNSENQLMRPAVVMDMEAHAVSLDVVRPVHDLSLVIVLLFAIQFLMTLYYKTDQKNKLATLAAFLFFALSSKVFPWNAFTRKIPAVTMIQFPARLLLPAVVLILLALALSLEEFLKEENKRKERFVLIYLALTLLCLGAVKNHLDNSLEANQVWQSNELFSSTKNNIFKTKDRMALKNSFQTKNLGEPLDLITKRNSDYLPVADKEIAYRDDFHPYGKQKRALLTNPINDRLKKRVVDGKLQLIWQGNGKETLLPVIIYKRTKVELNGSLLRADQIKKNDVGALQIQAKKGKNIVSVYYQDSFAFFAAMLVTLISWIAFALFLFFVI